MGRDVHGSSRGTDQLFRDAQKTYAPIWSVRYAGRPQRAIQQLVRPFHNTVGATAS